MKEKLLNSLTKAQMRSALKKLGVKKMDKKPLDSCRKALESFSYGQIVESLK